MSEWLIFLLYNSTKWYIYFFRTEPVIIIIIMGRCESSGDCLISGKRVLDKLNPAKNKANTNEANLRKEEGKTLTDTRLYADNIDCVPAWEKFFKGRCCLFVVLTIFMLIY